jgi:hypothetical protein
LLVSSRSNTSANKLATELNQINPSYEIFPATIDQLSDSFEHDLEKLSPNIVIHTAGPSRDELSLRGATPCLGLVNLNDFDHEVESLEISWHADTYG